MDGFCDPYLTAEFAVHVDFATPRGYVLRSEIHVVNFFALVDGLGVFGSLILPSMRPKMELRELKVWRVPLQAVRLSTSALQPMHHIVHDFLESHLRLNHLVV